jgi:hypothetical protein
LTGQRPLLPPPTSQNAQCVCNFLRARRLRAVPLASQQMFAFAFVWPWIGLGAAGLLLILLTTNALRGDRAVARWRDMTWLTWASTCVYLLHQIEEHGIDAESTTHAFRGSLCALLGFGNPQVCAVPHSFITAVNISAVWVARPLSALLASRWPVIGLSFFAIPFANLFAHVVPGGDDARLEPRRDHAGGPVPASVIAGLLGGNDALSSRLPCGAGNSRRRRHPACYAGRLLDGLFLRGSVSLDLLIAIQIANPFLSALIVVLGARRRSVRRFAT